MHLPDMPKRLIPFPFVLVAITGTFILVALYADVRGRERRAEITNVNTPVVGAIHELPLPDEIATSTSAEGGENPPLQQIPEPLGLSPEIPTSDVPEVAVFDCWRYEWRGDRLIVDRDYRHIAGDGIVPAVGPETVHLRCKDPQYALRSDDTSVAVYWSGNPFDYGRDEIDRPASVEANTLYRINLQTGEITPIARLASLDQTGAGYALAAFTKDLGAVFLRYDNDKNHLAASSLFRITLGGDVRQYSYSQIGSPLEITPDQSRAVGFEFTPGMYDAGEPVYLHRVNLVTGKQVRTNSLPALARMGYIEENNSNERPEFIDDERLVVRGGGPRLIVVNIFSGKTAEIPGLTGGFMPLIGLNADRSTLFTFSDSMPLTAISVAELPKP